MAFSIKDGFLYKDGQQVRYNPSPNLTDRMPDYRYLVMHYMAGRSLRHGCDWLVRPIARASAHLGIGRDAEVEQLVPFTKIAWHAGESKYQGLRHLNWHSIGIELDNAGRLTKQNGVWKAWFGDRYDDNVALVATHKNESAPSGWHTYTPEQIEVAVEIGALLVVTYGLQDVLGHDDIAVPVGRKCDPGPAFPMDSFRSKIMGRQDEARRRRISVDAIVRLRARLKAGFI